MARFNEILVGRFNRALQKLTGIKGPVPSPQLASEIMPVLNMFRGVEDRYTESWNRFGRAGGQTGGAGQFAAFQFRNPTANNIIAVFEKLSIFSSAADKLGILVSSQPADLTTVLGVSNMRLDSRGNPQPSLVLSSTVNFTLPASFQLNAACSAANITYDYIVTDDQEIALLPGDALTLFGQTAAQTINFTALWRERFLEESERA